MLEHRAYLFTKHSMFVPKGCVTKINTSQMFAKDEWIMQKSIINFVSRENVINRGGHLTEGGYSVSLYSLMKSIESGGIYYDMIIIGRTRY